MFKKRGGHNVKEPDFFVLFCFALFCLFVCLFVCLGGAHASQGKRREHKSLPTEYKRGITEN